MSSDTSTLIIQFLLFAAIVLAPWVIGGVRVRVVALRSDGQLEKDFGLEASWVRQAARLMFSRS